MTYVLLVVLLIGAWGTVLVWGLRGRASQRVDSVASFSKHLSVLERATPGRVVPLRTVEPAERGVHRISSTPQGARAPLAPEPVVAGGPTLTLAEAQRRRRTVLIALAGASAVAIVGALLVGGIMLVLAALSVAALAAYVALLVRAQRLGVERRSKVTYLTPASARATSAYDDGVVVARSAHGG